MRVMTISIASVLLTTGMLTNTSASATTEPAPVLCPSVSDVDSLNAAIAEVNTGRCDTITVSNSLTFSTGAPTAIDVATTPEPPGTRLQILTIQGTGSVNLTGPGPGLAITLGGDQDLVISNLTFTNFATTGSGGAISVSGGASVTIEDSTFTGNSTTEAYGNGGAIHANNVGELSIDGSTFETNESLHGSGGAIAATGTGSVRISGNSTFDGNEAQGVGGAIYTTQAITSSDSGYVDNVAGQDGGAIDAQGSVTSSGDEFDSNTARLYDGGAVRAPSGFTSSASAFHGNTAGRDGGAVKACPVIDVDSTFGGNSANRHGGAIYCDVDNDSLRHVLYGTRVEGNTASGSGGGLWTNIGLTASGETTFIDNEAANGGAIYVLAPDGAPSRNISLNVAVFESNSATDVHGGLGGAILISGAAPLSITRSRFGDATPSTGNTSSSGGGAIATSSSVTASDTDFENNRSGGVGDNQGGGAINAAGAVDVTRTTFVNNSAAVNEAGGGGGAVRTSSTFTANQSTFAENEKTGLQGAGGAVYAERRVEITESGFSENTSETAAGALSAVGGAAGVLVDVYIEGSTFIENIADSEGGALQVNGELELVDSLVEGNEAGAIGGGGASVRGYYDGSTFIGGNATITGSTFSGNDVTNGTGGAISTLRLTAHSSSFIENDASFGGGAAFVALEAEVTNATFYGNISDGPEGAAIQFDSSLESATLKFSTFAGSLSDYHPLIYSFDNDLDEAPTIALIGSALSPGSGDSCGWPGAGGMPLASTTRNSIATDASCDSPEVAEVADVDLGPLDDDSEPGTQVLPPEAGSILNSYTPSLGVTTDQLGVARPTYGFTSVGAVQVGATTLNGPQNASVEQGANAAFSVSADPGLGSDPTYQWQSSADGISWSNITGNASAQTATLSLPSVTLAQSGLRVRVNVTKTADGPTAPSRAATLTVSTSPGPEPSPANTPQPSVVTPERPANNQPTGQAPGTAGFVIDGQVIPVRSESGPRGTGLTLQAGPVEFTLRSQTANGRRVPLAADGSLILPRTGEVPISGDGLEPNSAVMVTLFSDPIPLGSTPVGADGTFRAAPVIPSTVPLGAHTLQLTGRTKTGDPFVLSIGVLVETPAAALGADPIISVRPAIVTPGTAVAVTARGVQVGCRVTFTLAGKRATTTASKKGVAQAQITMPKRLPRNAVVRGTVSGPKCTSVSVSSRVPTRHGSAMQD